MGSCFSKRVDIKIIDNIKKGKKHNYFTPRGETVLTTEEVYNVLMVNINFDN